MAKSKQKRAYLAQYDAGDREAGVYFAKTNIEARKAACVDLHGESQNLGGWSVVRAPWADKYVRQGWVPYLSLMGVGWWFECHGCGHTISEDAMDDDVGDQHYGPIDPFEIDRGIYCNHNCYSHYLRREHFKKQISAQALVWFMHRLNALTPVGAVPVTVGDFFNKWHCHLSVQDNGDFVITQAILPFEFPGMKIGKGALRYDDDKVGLHFTRCNGDSDAFDKWRAS